MDHDRVESHAFPMLCPSMPRPNQSSSMLSWSNCVRQWSTATGKGRCAIDVSSRIVSPGYITSWIVNNINCAVLEASNPNYLIPEGDVWFCVWRPCDHDGLAVPYDPAKPHLIDAITNYKLVGYNKASADFVEKAISSESDQHGSTMFCVRNQKDQIWCEAGDVIGWTCKDEVPGALLIENVGGLPEFANNVLTTTANKLNGIYKPGTMRSFDRSQKIRYYLDATVRVSLGSIITDRIAAKAPKPKRFKLKTSAAGWNVRLRPI